MGFSNEAVWVGKNPNFTNSIEGGFYTGASYDAPWTNSIDPYWTINDGGDETDLQGNPLPASTPISMITAAAAGAQPSALYITYGAVGTEGWFVDGGGYGVATPRQNFEQGEANSCKNEAGETWMGGGAENLYLLYESSNTGTFYFWGFQTVTSPPYPYFDYPTGAYTFTNGGY